MSRPPIRQVDLDNRSRIFSQMHQELGGGSKVCCVACVLQCGVWHVACGCVAWQAWEGGALRAARCPIAVLSPNKHPYFIALPGSLLLVALVLAHSSLPGSHPTTPPTSLLRYNQQCSPPVAARTFVSGKSETPRRSYSRQKYTPSTVDVSSRLDS